MTKFAADAVAVDQGESLVDAPSLIERIWPAQKLSAEAQKERKAVQGQTLNALGSYWKGRKPLVLVRACVLGALLPATDDPAEDLAVFELLMNIDDAAFAIRDRSVKPNEVASLLLSADQLDDELFARVFVGKTATAAADSETSLVDLIQSTRLSWAPSVSEADRNEIVTRALATLPYSVRVGRARRPEEIDQIEFASIWPRVNAHLGTQATSLVELVAEIGARRFGRLPRIADTFAGGGAIPFEAARLGCDTYAADLNPIACMLTWAGLNVVGATSAEADEFLDVQRRIIGEVETTVRSLGIERDKDGNQAKAYLYCMEALCPSSGWLVPMLPNFIISRSRNCIARLVPDPENKRYDIEIVSAVTDEEMKAAEIGTMVGGYLNHEIDGTSHRSSLKTIRGDYKAEDGSTRNNLRPWAPSDFMPAKGDIFQERLYCIQWITSDTIEAARHATFFRSVGPEDLERERIAEEFVRENIESWRAEGLIGDMPIMEGAETSRLRRERGWTCWHHLFTPRELIILSSALRVRHPATYLYVAAQLDYMSKLVEWRTVKGGGTGGPVETPNHVFYNQALNTFYNYANRSAFRFCQRDYFGRLAKTPVFDRTAQIVSAPASSIDRANDVFITDPPYADAVSYHEITEFFIAWLRKNPPSPFDDWKWDSRRPLAIKGDGEEFRREMVAAYAAMASEMPDNGLQIVMFTHQSGSVWADMAQIFWGAGLQVQAAWYIATETTSEIKKGGYVQGTVILVLRKRLGVTSGYEDEIVQDVRVEVAHQIETLVGLNQSLKGEGRIENVFEDSDLQMAGYAAALRVLTGYTRIDGRDMTAEALRPRRKGEVGFVDRMIDYAVAVANEHMVPEGIRPQLWQRLRGPERFYLKMMGLEAAGIAKLDNYQNFARAFRVADYTQFMGNMKPNAARLKTAIEFGTRTGFDIADFSNGVVRSVLFGVEALSRDVDADDVLLQLRDLVPDYFKKRSEMIEIADYFVRQCPRDSDEGRSAAIFANLLRNERL